MFPAHRLVSFVPLVVALSACQLVASYDAVFDQEIVSTQRHVDTLLGQMVSSSAMTSLIEPKLEKSKVTYSAVAQNYVSIDMDFDDLSSRATLHENNFDTQIAVSTIRHTFDAVRDQHAKDGVLDVAHVRNERLLLDHEFLLLMKQEITKHHSS